MVTIEEALRSGAETLHAASITSPAREAALLLRHVLKCDAAYLYAHGDERLNAVASIFYKAVVKRRAAHEPFQLITGVQEFYRLEFRVTPDVLIPRPETEILVEDAIAEFCDRQNLRFCEVGVGSGCISIALLVNLQIALGVGVDISETALKVANENAVKHGVIERLELKRSDVFENILDEKFDLIVSNPPYVPHGDLATLQEEVRSFEPRTALDGGEDGLDVVRRIVAESPKYLNSGALLYVEIGWNQFEHVGKLLDRSIWESFDFLPDLQGISRILKARLK
jgi:release factor glutamine methyltransferase